MIKRLIFSLIALLVLVLIIFFSYRLFMNLESSPNKSKVEEMVATNNLKEFGEIEGSYLYTPNNFGFYNENNIYIVEQNFGKEENYNNKYVVIDAGKEIMKEEEMIIEEIKQNPEIKNNLNRAQFPSKHKVTLYENGKVIQEEWFIKAIYVTDSETKLSFIPLDYSQDIIFNLSTEGHEKFESF